MKLADNLDMHKISNELNSCQIGLFTSELLALPYVLIDTIFNFDWSLIKTRIAWTGIRSRTSSNSGKIGLFTLELLAAKHPYSTLSEA